MEENTNKEESKRLGILHKVILSIIAVFLIFAIVFGIYTLDYYRADNDAMSVVREGGNGFTIENEDDYYLFKPNNSINAGFVFYPGGKVACEAYAPLLANLAEKGVTCILLKMPANLAVLKVDAAKGIRDMVPGVDKWYIGGHSLGGSIAGKYLKKSKDDYNGIILLASYLADDLSDTDMRALLIYGSNDTVLDMERFNDGLRYLPKSSTTKIIEGGCHSYFGSYGMQEGDGAPAITREEQYKETVDLIIEFITEH